MDYYKLQSGDKDNSKHMLMMEMHPELKQIIIKNSTFYTIQQSIFSEKLDEAEEDFLVSALTIGGELKHPIDIKLAQVLYFVLQVNLHNYNSRIRNIAKAYIFYDDFEGDYSKVTFIDTKNAIVHLAKIFYHGVVPGISIVYKIPFYVINGISGYHFTIADLPKYTMLINDQAVTITRKSLYHLLDDKYANSFRNHEEIMAILNPSLDILKECLEDAQFEKYIVDFPFDTPNSLEYTSDNQLLAWESIKNESEYWKSRGKNKYGLNLPFTNIVPFLPDGDKMLVYINK